MHSSFVVMVRFSSSKSLHYQILMCFIVQGAVDWLEKNENKTDEEITALAAEADVNDEFNPNIEPAALKPGEEAKSLVCNDCKCISLRDFSELALE